MTGHKMRGAVFGPWFTFIDSEIDLDTSEGKGVYIHEKVHQWQMERYGLPGFLVVYYADFFTHGYAQMQAEKIPFKLSFGWLRQLIKRGYSRDLPLEREANYVQKCYQEGAKIWWKEV